MRLCNIHLLSTDSTSGNESYSGCALLRGICQLRHWIGSVSLRLETSHLQQLHRPSLCLQRWRRFRQPSPPLLSQSNIPGLCRFARNGDCRYLQPDTPCQNVEPVQHQSFSVLPRSRRDGQHGRHKHFPSCRHIEKQRDMPMGNAHRIIGILSGRQPLHSSPHEKHL